ncbi:MULTISPECIES: single-stranded-DNA-specific exonuclease RecJ [unclassified Clostridium]|uniref:single-stranded-DNA-specific exonuclease RecJ n=1 Tax=unclassified Clostridium TaxID=2614128 RepID=UPI001C8B2B0F|nr:MULTISPECIES: single-stranded-DNA-specific exonuclease RecJ [unclassified Clostridium]MBX9137804.1 single-stranded-DNA-specific exonuclease RecJ [Clostridium sp. K12(2020)]MBX9143541.1 single-stranded-DNA-specific exonuclease RecJ [Clostridium sp. K13]MDU2290195.1 single-stranded-DNA-specific exonuclease RecJ [Clostridium celatum]
MVRNVKFDTLSFANQLGISQVVARLLVNRGIYNIDIAKEFLGGNISEFNNPKDMLGMNGAVELMQNSIISSEKILIVGDYDVDGVISTYVLYTAIKKCGGNVTFHIPDRIKEGYGINESIIKKASEDNVDIIITCDNGIAAIEQTKLAKELGLKVIITDHHDVPFVEENGERKYVVPNADFVLNPKQEECKYKFDKICGATVAYKFVECLYEKFNINKEELYDLLQYVAIATVCDVVDLTSENRIIVKEGLKRINSTNNIGLKALFKETGLEDKTITVYTLGFVIGPSINASGRLEQAEWALKMLLSDNEIEAKELAEKLNDLNKERQELTKEGLEEALEIIEKNNMAKDKVLVVYLEDVHESIAGIIAGRVREKYNLPTIILTKAHDGAKGSGRSIEEYNMFEELLKCKDLLGKFGGHPMAAGMSIPKENIDEFRRRLNNVTTLTEEDVIPKVSIDMGLTLSQINYELIDEISLLEPYGKANPKPTFGMKKLKVVEAKILGKNKNVLKLKLTDGRLYIEGIYFGDIEGFENSIKDELGENEYNKVFNGISNSLYLDIICMPDINEFNGNKKVQLVISNYRISK